MTCCVITVDNKKIIIIIVVDTVLGLLGGVLEYEVMDRTAPSAKCTLLRYQQLYCLYCYSHILLFSQSFLTNRSPAGLQFLYVD